jgi:alginate O-acetyltransferase complex protein AlgI
MTGARVITIAAFIITVLVFFKVKTAYKFDGSAHEVLIPLGLSYYSFRCIHYLIEKYKGTLADHTFPDFSSYLLFLPTILAGPIHRFGPYERDSRRRRWDAAKFAEGLERIVYGYAKVSIIAGVLLADYAASLIAQIGPGSPALIAYLTMLQKGFIGYLLFSGYSDIAIGFALTLGYRVMENFNWPFLARNISDFWRRWHISLSSWCREYIYMVVLSLTRRPALGAIAAMLVLGLWHEISFRYILWGAYHGLGIAVWQGFQDTKERLPTIENKQLRLALKWLSIAFTFHYVMFGFVMVQEDTLEAAMSVYRALLWEPF